MVKISLFIPNPIFNLTFVQYLEIEISKRLGHKIGVARQFAISKKKNSFSLKAGVLLTVCCALKRLAYNRLPIEGKGRVVVGGVLSKALGRAAGTCARPSKTNNNTP